ncbi:MAG: lipid-A-disaccharide synthase [Xanthobacteraceae bacterium]
MAEAANDLTIAVIAGEPSGDRLGGALMQAIKARAPRVRFVGVGGAEMAAQGLKSVFPIDELAIIGLVAIFQRLPSIFAHIRAAADAVIAARPDALVIIDSPEFTHRVARRVRKALPHLPIIDYVCPSVWAWRPWRARAMRAYVDHVLALLPFEPDAMTRLGGPSTTFVGHPLAAEVTRLRPGADDAARRAADPPLVLVLPGSRGEEIKRHLPMFGETTARLAATAGAIEPVLPTPPHLAARVKEAVEAWPVRPRVVTTEDEKWAAFRQARAALAASGTVTLELALASVPTVVAYRIPLFEEAIARLLIKVPTIVLANLVLGENVMPELIQRHATPEKLVAALAPLVTNTPERLRQLVAFARLDEAMAIGKAQPSETAANVVLELAASRIGP